MPSSKIDLKKQGNGGKSSRKANKQKEDDPPAEVYLTIFVFRGQPDVYYKRHVLLYITSDDPDFHETIHVQRNDDTSPWTVDRDDHQRDWSMSASYITHVNAGFVMARRGEEGAVVDTIASTSVEGKEQYSDWNCQNYLLEGLRQLVDYEYQTEEWYEYVENELTTALLDGAVG